ncbi:MAG: enoyl-CoA hydratase/isomerase family protein [Deltaproteobacteria bacterium]|nr:enoyl-CoA hydratase/isomerase family protein [Deltaproteobacteria bacterium]
MKTYQDIKVEIADGVAKITIDRPSAMNALNTNVLAELADAALCLGADPAVRVIVVTGAGKAFVAGADIKEMKDMDLVSFRSFVAGGQRALYVIETVEKPVIAAINGFALGGGCELALACDFRVASEKAKFGFPEVGLGIFPGFGGTQRAPRFFGKGMAAELIYTGAMIDAAEALRIGLVNHVYPAESLMDEAMKIAKTIAAQGPLAVQRAKTAVKMAGDTTMEAGLAFEREAMVVTFATKDRFEGMSAFVEKRKPVFKGE